MTRRLSLRGVLSAGVAVLAASALVSATDELPYQALAERVVGPDQGVYVVAEDGRVLASVVADRPVHPASVSKVAATLALLRELGPDHRFATRLKSAAPRDGTVPGDLAIEATGDPFLLPQSVAFLLGGMADLGIDRVEGRVRVEGPLFYDWKPDPRGLRIEAALAGKLPPAAWREAATRRGREGGGPRSAGLTFGRAKTAPGAPEETLLVHLSPPLPRILKELNAYSNNIFHPLADRVGGAAAVERMARATVPATWTDEVVLTNAAGAGTANRLSPRAAVALVRALTEELARHGLAPTDVLPVAGRDRGTLEKRLDAPDLRGAVVAKTGTYGSLGASSLAGVARTERYGDVTFAILNHGVPVPEARRRQDAFVAALLRDAGAEAWPYEPRPSPILVEEAIVAKSG